MKLNIYPEECCDECMEIIHNHVDCPVCGEDYEETNAYFNLNELDVGEEFECLCGASFILVGGQPYNGADWILALK